MYENQLGVKRFQQQVKKYQNEVIDLSIRNEKILSKLEKVKKEKDKLRGWRVEMTSYVKVLIKNQNSDDESDKELNDLINNKCYSQMKQLLAENEINEMEKESKKIQQKISYSKK